MGKRKELQKSRKQFEEESSSDEDTDLLDVDFEFFDPQPEVDFHGLKTLLRQLLDIDAELIDLSALSDLILSQPLLGSTVKVDGNTTDPYAFLTVLNLHAHKENPVIKALIDYVAQQAAKNPALSPVLEALKAPSQHEVGLILTERLINVPAQVVPPMYKMLLEEITWAVEEKEPYTFSYYLILSKTYQEVKSLLDEEDNRPQKKKKKSDGVDSKLETFYFHPEDEVLHRNAIAYGDYSYTRESREGSADSKRTFQELGIKPQGHMVLLEAKKFEATVKALEEYLSPS